MLHAVVIFLGAFLAFLIQPLVGNTLLPAFGGSAAVWSSCLASFQILLVAGYFYAHCVGRSGRPGMFVHVALLLVACGWLFGVAFGHRMVVDFAERIPWVSLGALLSVVALVAVPSVLLSANSSLVQALSGGRYGLYAVSNAGSLLGLLGYPLVFESCLPLPAQWLVVAGLAVVYTVLFAVLSGTAGTVGSSGSAGSAGSAGMKGLGPFVLSFVSCYLLNAVSVHLCSDVTPLPMLWALLLALYLLSYILAFTGRGSAALGFVSVVFVPLSAYALWHYGLDLGGTSYLPELVAGSAVLFFGGWAVHAELYRIRPAAEGLTRYYLMIALGGACGGAVCSFLMPVVSNTVCEYPLSVVLVLAVVLLSARAGLYSGLGIPAGMRVRADCAVGAVLLLAAAWGVARGYDAYGEVLLRYRNFYGAGHVARWRMNRGGGVSYESNVLRSGGTVHGFQKASDGWKGEMPTGYYAEHAGGLAILSHPKYAARRPLRVALCGMGIGTLATYARSGDEYRFYEINPAVAAIAGDPRYFTFLSKAMGKVDVVVDDARRALERERREGAGKYDVLVVDVFTGDSIPAHMITREAVALYLDRLEEDGILAFHLSNWHVNLLPVVKAAGATFGLETLIAWCCKTDYAMDSVWAFLSKSGMPVPCDGKLTLPFDLAGVPVRPMMTDDFHPLLPYIMMQSSIGKPQWQVSRKLRQ